MRYTKEEYKENIRKVGCCPCGYVIQNAFSALSHWALHKANGGVVDDILTT